MNKLEKKKEKKKFCSIIMFMSLLFDRPYSIILAFF